jgi:hypothetical protein
MKAANLATKNVAERALLASYRSLTPQGRMALDAWMRFFTALFADDKPPIVKRAKAAGRGGAR